MSSSYAIDFIGKAILTPFALLSRLPGLLSSMKSSSLLEYTKVTRVEPIALIDHSISHLPETEDVCRTLTALFAGYYLQGVAVSHNVGNIQTKRTLGKLNPNRDISDSFGSDGFMGMFGMENYINRLPRPQDGAVESIPTRKALSLEAFNDEDFDPEEHEYLETLHSGNGDSSKAIREMSANLSTGIMLEVELSSNGDRAIIPISVRLISTPTPKSVLTQLVSHTFHNRTMKERWHGWRSGELSFIKDIILCQDVIDSHRETLIKDESGAYHEIVARKNKNKWSGLLSLNPSVATASNIIVMSEETMKEIEREVGMSFSRFKSRQQMFKAAYLIIVAVIDTRNQLVTIYHRDISLPTEASFRELKRTSGKNNGGEVIEYLNSYMLGTNPQF